MGWNRNGFNKTIKKGVDIIKCTKLYRHIKQYLASETCAPGNGSQRADTASTASPVKHRDGVLPGAEAETEKEKRNRSLPRYWPLKKQISPQQLPTYMWSMMSMVWRSPVDYLQSAVLDLLLPDASLHLQLDSWKVLCPLGNNQDINEFLYFFLYQIPNTGKLLEKSLTLSQGAIL